MILERGAPLLCDKDKEKRSLEARGLLSLALKNLLQKIFQPFCGEPCVGFIMTKCYDGKNAKTNACGSGIQAPLVATPTPFHNVVKNFMNLHSNPFTAPRHC